MNRASKPVHSYWIGQSFGLVSLVDPDLDATQARPLWRAEVDRSVVVAEVLDADPSPLEGLDLLAVASLVTLEIAPNDDQHLLLSDGAAEIRIDIERGTLLGGRALLDFHVWGAARLRLPLLTLRRLVALVMTGQLLRTLFPPERHASRWILELRVADALAQGASHREIADVLFETMAGTDRARGTSAARSRVQRLVRIARSRCQDGAHLDFLKAQ